MNKICPSPDGTIEKGHIIFLSGSIDEIWFRLLSKHKHWRKNEIRDLQKQIREIYTFRDMTEINTTNRPIEEVVREVAKVIFSRDYAPIDIKKRLEGIAKGRQKP